MGDCKHTDRIGTWLDGEVPPDEGRALERHVGECPACARELGRLRALRRLLQAAAPPALSPEALRRVHGAVGELRSRGLVRLAARLTLAAAAVLAISVGWLLRAESAAPSQSRRQPTWAKVAVTLSVSAETESSAETQLAQWMADSLLLETVHD